MVHCGVEEPLLSNEYLYSTDDNTGDPTLATFNITDLNRYSFTRLLPESHGRIIEEILRIPFCFWAVIAPYEMSSDFKIRHRVGAASLRKQGFQVGIYNDQLVATKAYQKCAFDNLWPYGLEIPHPGWPISIMLLESDNVSTSVFADQIDSPIFRAMVASPKRISPSYNFLQWLSRNNTIMAYCSTDVYDQSGMVMVSPRRLDVMRLINLGLVNRIWTGPAAGKVWSMDP